MTENRHPSETGVILTNELPFIVEKDLENNTLVISSKSLITDDENAKTVELALFNKADIENLQHVQTIDFSDNTPTFFKMLREKLAMIMHPSI